MVRCNELLLILERARLQQKQVRKPGVDRLQGQRCCVTAIFKCWVVFDRLITAFAIIV